MAASPPVRLALQVLLVLGVAAAATGCGGDPGGRAETAAGSSSAAPSGTAAPAPTGAGTSAGTVDLVLARSGGVAGFADRLRVASDGRAALQGRAGDRPCALPVDVVRGLQEVDWASMPSAAPPAGPRSDAMSYVVTAAGRRVVLDADAPAEGQRAAVRLVALAFDACTRAAQPVVSDTSST